MRILHAANFSLYPNHYHRRSSLANYYITDRSISYGLAQNRHCVFDFSVEDAFRHYHLPRRPWHSKRKSLRITNDILLRTALRFEPDLLLLGHTRQIAPETLRTLRERIPTLKIAQWWLDTLSGANHLPKDTPLLKAKLPYLDALFTTSCSEYMSSMLGFDQSNARKIYFMPNVCNSSVCVGRSFENENYASDVFFAAKPVKHREALIKHLVNLTSRYKIELRGAIQKNPIGGAEYINAMAQSKICISTNRAIVPYYTSDRWIHITGNGSLALCEYSPELDKLFNKDEVVYYNSLEEFDKHLHYYLSHDDERRTVARKGWERAHKDYNEVRVSQFILDTLFSDVPADKYHWANY